MCMYRSRILMNIGLVLMMIFWRPTSGALRMPLCSDKLVAEENVVIMLGSAHNSGHTCEQDAYGGWKRNANSMFPSFYVDDAYQKQTADDQHTLREAFMAGEETGYDREERKLIYKWDCLLKIEYEDLGQDYYPRYHKRVKCRSKSLTDNHCVPLSMTMPILRRKSECCAMLNRNDMFQHYAMWVWEERNVTVFCNYVP